MPPLLELNVFTVLVFFAIGLAVWFLVTREMGSTRRMKCMMEELGLDYDLAATSDPATEAIISKARGKCLKCRSEGLCERWQEAQRAGEPLLGVTEEDFCPNAGTFKALARKGALQVEPSVEPPAEPDNAGGRRMHTL